MLLQNYGPVEPGMGPIRLPSCRLVPFGGQSLAGCDDSITKRLGQLCEIGDDVLLKPAPPQSAWRSTRGQCVVSTRGQDLSLRPSSYKP